MINHGGDKPSCIQSEKYPICGGLAESKGLHKLCSVFEGIQEPFNILSLSWKSVVYKTMFTYIAESIIKATKRFPKYGGI